MRFLFRQLYDAESSTYTYLLASLETKEALLIDPVVEQVDRDAKIIKDLGLELKYGLNTHVHADHVTGTALLKKQHFPNMVSALGKTGNAAAKADLFLEDGSTLKMGNVALEVRSTPGHTNGCHTFIDHDHRTVFTGDALLIQACGRTDFQQGDAKSLYLNVHEKILSLPEDYTVFPAHDYKGRTASTIWEEKRLNPRLTKPLVDFEQIMKNLNLPYPKKIDVSVPLNLVDGYQELLHSAQPQAQGQGS
jgi:sulfur dioxygenase